MRVRPTSLGFTLIELMICIVILGLLAVTAIPAFIKYTRRTYGAEAIMDITKISQGSMAYYMSEHADQSGDILPRQFPLYDLVATGGRECPLYSYRCTPGNNYYTSGSKYAPIAFSSACLGYYGATTIAFFESVNFGMDDPFYYSVYGNNYGLPNYMQIGALADLDCNGVVGYYQRFLSINADGGVQASAVYTINPLE